MKKLTIIILSVTLLMVSGCTSKSTEIIKPTATVEEATQTAMATATPTPSLISGPTSTPTLTPTPITETKVGDRTIMVELGEDWLPFPEDEHRNNDASISKDLMKVQLIDDGEVLRYKNKKQGYSLDFPKAWKDYLLIFEGKDGEIVSIYFFGKSLIGQGWFYFLENNVGIYLFSVQTLNSFSKGAGGEDLINDSLKAKEINFCATSSTGVTVSVLELAAKEVNDGSSSFIHDELECSYIIEDEKIAVEIYDGIRDILSTFKELP